MRIVIDMQGAQSDGSRNRGIGRYTHSLVTAIIHNRKEHDVFLALNGAFPDTIEPIRAAYGTLLPQTNICVWNALTPMASIEHNNNWRRQVAELIYEAFLVSLQPDVVYVSSLFEGLVDNAVSSIGRLPRNFVTAVTLYDLIPFIHRKPYLDNPLIEDWYLEKIAYLQKFDLWLAISESSRQEGITHLGLPANNSVNISTDADSHFTSIIISEEAEHNLREKYGLKHNFVMYTGGIDHRKNIEGLIRAYAQLPSQLRTTHQLAIVCSIQENSRSHFQQLALAQGLTKGELILTGYVPEDDLIALYNICALFVFPSWHEGFGLPALEAMRCGAPVIAANTSSLPEVIGLPAALFDPYSDEAIAQTMKCALADSSFRTQLIEHGKTQAKKFSWDESAQRAITAMEQAVAKHNHNICTKKHDRPKLAYVSPLPPERSGIADYSAELLPQLAQHYDIELIIAQDNVTTPWIKSNCPTRSIQWFVENASSYERVLYHFGNSSFHQHMFGLLKQFPGVVVLHDFYLSGVLNHMQALAYAPGCFTAELYNSHGYVALSDLHQCKDIAEIIWKYPCSKSVIDTSKGVIVHSPNTLRLAKQWYNHEANHWAVIPLIRDSKTKWERQQARKHLDLTDNDFLICSFGILGPTKLNHRLLKAWLNSDLAKARNCHLIFVGDYHPGDYGAELLTTIECSRVSNNVRITGWANEDLFHQYLAAADVGVQLRTLSRGETSAAVLDCMNYGLATIVNANGSMADLDTQAVWMLPDEFTDQELVTALETLWNDSKQRKNLGVQARNNILSQHNPTQCAEQYKVAIEQFYSREHFDVGILLPAIAHLQPAPPNKAELISLANAIAMTFPPANAPRQLLVDISELVQRDTGNEIQRVVRNVLKEWLLNPPSGWRIEPVYATADQPYRYARQFTLQFLGMPTDGVIDETIDYTQGDIFFGLDIQPQIQTVKADFYQHLRRQGISVQFMVYDLLCIHNPEHFVSGAADQFTNWLNVVGESDGTICISKAVAQEFSTWVQSKAWKRQRPFAIDWVHLGADINNVDLTPKLLSDTQPILTTLKKRPTFLMVGTIEPRKGHSQVVDAFEQLWLTNNHINLVIVGKKGGMVETFTKRLHSHPELNNRLFWLEGINDNYLEQIYKASTCLIAASEGEGFGLPLIEAAQHKIPIIARNLPVFREVAGDHAFYFETTNPENLAQAIKNWLALHEKKQHPTSDTMPWLTWKESAAQLLAAIHLIDGNHE